MNALGMYPGRAGSLGSECAGVIVAVGSKVTRFAVGDPVMAFAPGGMAKLVTLDQRIVAPLPEGLSFEQGATIPLVFLTAWYALNDLAKMKAGEVLLVHAAAGGVGMAAVQVAKMLGVEVLGTASASKQDLVRSLGVTEVASSRDLTFAELWKGRRVDAVLNALAGAFVDAGLGLLKEGGRFLEMGKTDVREADEVAAAHPGVWYRAFDLSEAGPDRIGEMLELLSEGFRSGQLTPLPVKSWPIAEAEGAFRFMAAAQHVGKLALTADTTAARTDGAVLVTGGLGALGRLISRWLVEDQGYRHLVLTSRSGPRAKGADELVAELAELGATVDVVAGDVGDEASLKAVLAGVKVPLRGVVHAAGVLDDALVAKLTPERIEKVMAPKVRGAWNLHQATKDLDLDFFVLFSSVAGSTGSQGQANYSAANAWLDGLADLRRTLGLPALSVAWGPWASGMAADLSEEERAAMAGRGMVPIPEELGRTLWRELVRRQDGALVGTILDLRALQVAFSAAPVPPFFRTLVVTRKARGAKAAADSPFIQELIALTPKQRENLLRDTLAAEIAKALNLGGPEAVPPGRPLAELGLDSLLAIELRNALSRRIGAQLPATFAFDHPTLDAMTVFLLEQLSALLPDAEASGSPELIERRAVRTNEPIAIVGMALRLPGHSNTPEQFWDFLATGNKDVRRVPEDRWDADFGYTKDMTPGRTYVNTGSFMDDIMGFDAEAFRLSAGEARGTDPQQRLLLETAWEALEPARIAPESLVNTRTGVFVGISHSEYGDRFDADDPALPYGISGNDNAFAAGRLAYVFGLRGPAMAISTTCSSSLVAIHEAVRALRTGDANVALAGGVHVIGSIGLYILLSQIGALSPDGVCHSFDAKANGYGRGEGVGMLVLKPLSLAEADGDRVLAVIRGSAINHDGRSTGLTVPSGPAQSAVIRDALQDAGLTADQVSVVEAHGTGTPLGDPIEVRAMGEVYGVAHSEEEPLVIGTVKSSIGHLESGAGVAAVIKAVLALRNEMFPPTRVEKPNPELPLDEFNIRIATEAMPWPRGEKTRRIGVSSFGLSGTNAHLILEEAPQTRPLAPVRVDGPVLWTVSGRTAAAARANARSLADAVVRDGLDPLDVARSLVETRSPLEHRISVAGTSTEALVAALRGAQPTTATHGRVAFVFSGQGSQRLGMGKELHAAHPAFRAAFDEALAALEPHVEGSLRDVIWGEDASLLEQTAYTQPALFAMEVALAELWRAVGVEPDVVTGHSVGEFAAAVVAGLLSLEDAARLVAVRGRLMGALPAGGAMVVIRAEEAEITPLLGPGVSLAAVNAPGSCVVSGDEEAVLAVARSFEERGVRTTRLAVSHAFHSHRMDPILEELREVAASVTFRAPVVRMVATSEGDMATPAYWVGQARGAVRFADAVGQLSAAGALTFVEIGPQVTLLGLVAQTLPDLQTATVSSLEANVGEREAFLRGVGRYWGTGRGVVFSAVLPEGGTIVDLPKYAWQKRKFWAELPAIMRFDPRTLVHATTWTERALPRERVPVPGAVALVADRGGFADQLARELRKKGLEPVVVKPGETIPTEPSAPSMVVHLAALDAGTDDVAAAVRDVPLAALSTAQAVPEVPLVLVTRGAVDAGGVRTNPAQAMLWGFGRSLAKERGEDVTRLLDLDASTTPERLAAILTAGDPEPRSALRGDTRLVPSSGPATVDESGAVAIRPDATYLVTGGLGALGLVFTEWLVEQGAKSVVLTGRSAPNDEARARLDAWKKQGADVGVIRGDVADEADVKRIMAEIEASRPALAGVIHSAGVLDDGIVQRQTEERFRKVLRPKVDGSWNLHVATRERKLDFFMMCSSTAAGMGSPGQTNYSAANAWLDGLCEMRRADGLPATSIQWGPWGEVGMAAQLDQEHRDRLAMAGLRELKPNKALRAMALCLNGPNVAIVDIIGARPAATLPGAGLGATLPVALDEGVAGVPTLATGEPGRLQQLARSLPREEWHDALMKGLVEGLAEGLPDKVFDPAVPLWDQGMDSMMVLELRNRIVRDGVQLPVNRMIAGPSLEEITQMLIAALEVDPFVTSEERKLPAGVVVPAEGKDVAPDEELQALSPVASHGLAAVGGGLVVGAIVYLIMQFVL
ncbi:MAG: SDR family NAD(P)-dependent oxidoreductase [Myxococcales bacterium]|nr:SDR family NAD(P)-dependent oxidoreductase [Myxococcales bacterium]